MSEMMSSTNHSWFHILLIGVAIIAVNSNKAVLKVSVSCNLEKGREEGRNSEFYK